MTSSFISGVQPAMTASVSSAALGDGDHDLSSSLTRYYTEKSTLSGFWTGGGVIALHLRDGQRVTEPHLELLLSHGLHPLTAKPLGRAYPIYPSRVERITVRVATLDATLDDATRQAEVARIEAEEHGSPTKHAAAGFDLTFSVPKSVSVLWGLADAWYPAAHRQRPPRGGRRRTQLVRATGGLHQHRRHQPATTAPKPAKSIPPDMSSWPKAPEPPSATSSSRGSTTDA